MGKKKKFNDYPFPYRTEIELEISTLTNLGVGLGRVRVPSGDTGESTRPWDRDPAEIENRDSKIENSSGWVVMVPFTLPGEKIRARVYRNHKNYSEADLLHVLVPSPHRIAPKCPLFGTCGGCQYQHLTYPEQLKWKRQQVEELLKYMAGVEFSVTPVIGSPREFGYRSKITPHFQGRASRFTVHGSDPESASAENRELKTVNQPIGFLKQGARFELVDVPACPIATPEINEKLTEVRARTRARLAAGEYKRDATLLLRHAQEGVITDYDAVIHEVIPQESFQRSAISDQPKFSTSHLSTLTSQPREALRLHFLSRDFFQNNPFILPAFTGYVREQAAGTGASFLVDAYCGSGLFALSCAPAFERVAGIEISETSIQFARENATANGITNATFQAGDAAKIFAGLTFAPANTAVVIDPPRKGCDESFLQQLFAFGPRAVVYVSCDPATQMRDLKHFLVAGYTLTAVQPFDLFPQTRHLECVITLVKQ
ncbi:MAG TPA: class I SAM-dependent RNA methyltransferase [Candidatus Didemnitutus sp.]|nr:class I SAM-dependent RNA methyltransferase [Candidatus Didemnitutus sp.]